jgi:tRNA-2-methylthio-N6-dimethylallyladenosine synthase
MPTYNIWTIGCQMNKAESRKMADCLELLGYDFASTPQKADLIVLNTCVVRQTAENKVLGMLGYLKGIKRDNPGLPIFVTGCFVNSAIEELKKRFPHVDLFFKPGAYPELLNWMQRHKPVLQKEKERLQKHKISPTAFVPIIQGCNNFCSYCIVPYRRGKERSRSLQDIVNEVSEMVQSGVKEVTLVGQNVNSYGYDFPEYQELSELFSILNSIDGLARIRFLTNHPKDMSLKLIESIAYLDKVCEHITLPLQSGDDNILKAMRRGYTAEQYCHLVSIIRNNIPAIALSTDVIVGFPGETEEQFNHTLNLIKKIRFDTVHIAAYSPRQGTIASREFEDNVSSEIKKKRLEKIETAHAQIAGEINSNLCGEVLEVLVEGKKRGKWYGRSRSDKLVFFEENGDYLGQMVDVVINNTSPWALQGKIKNQ